MTSDDVDQAFWSVCLADFPGQEQRLRRLLPAARAAAAGGDLRPLERACAAFLSEGQSWPRFDKYLADWQLVDPRLPEVEDEWPVPAGRTAPPPGELLAHRILMASHTRQRLLRHRDNVVDRPYWRLVAIDDGRTCEECKGEARTAHRWDSAYWQTKTLPCERLLCRCRVVALTEKEHGEWEQRQ